MPEDLTNREFIKTAAMGIDAVNTIDIFPEKVFAEDNLSVKTRYGTFNGFLDKNGVKTWFGIPYAQPPVEKLRWRDPQPLKTSNKTFDAKKLGFILFGGKNIGEKYRYIDYYQFRRLLNCQ